MNTHVQRVEITQRAFLLSVAAQVYDDILLEEQRVLRELNRVQERLEHVRKEKRKYENRLGL